MALQCYIDESSDGKAERIVAMAGYIADSKTWSAFSFDWREILTKQKRSYFHSSNRMFASKHARRDTEAFYRVIERHINSAFAVTTDVEVYRKAFKQFQFPNSLGRAERFHLLREPHLLMYQAFFEMSLHEKSRLGLMGPIDFVFDDTERYRNLATDALKYMYFSALELGVSEEDLGAFPTFEDDKLSPPLQAAELLVRLVRSSAEKGEAFDTSKLPWKRMKPIYCLTVDLNEAYWLNRFRTALSKENLDIYRSYNEATT